MMARSTNRSNRRPDTLMQDRKANKSMKPLATHGRTIHLGHFRPCRSIAADGRLSPDSVRAGWLPATEGTGQQWTLAVHTATDESAWAISAADLKCRSIEDYALSSRRNERFYTARP